MRVNIYAEEMTNRIELITKEVGGEVYTGIRFYLELPVTKGEGSSMRGPFMHHRGDDDSAAVTFWGKKDLKTCLENALALLNSSTSATKADGPKIGP